MVAIPVIAGLEGLGSRVGLFPSGLYGEDIISIPGPVGGGGVRACACASVSVLQATTNGRESPSLWKALSNLCSAWGHLT